MTSFKEPNFSYTETTLRREVHTDNSHWELMYKAMLAQLMTYVDAAVTRSLAECGVDELLAERARAAIRSDAAGPQAAARSENHRFEPGMGAGPFAGVVLPPWLQPFTLPEHVRFTRTPDALLRHDRPAAEAEAEAHDEAADAVPHWRKPVVLPANVRFNRTPYPKPFEAAGGDDETVGAQTFTGEFDPSDSVGDGVVIALADIQAERALQAAALSASEVGSPASCPEVAVPPWFGVLHDESMARRPATNRTMPAPDPRRVATTAPHPPRPCRPSRTNSPPPGCGCTRAASPRRPSV